MKKHLPFLDTFITQYVLALAGSVFTSVLYMRLTGFGGVIALAIGIFLVVSDGVSMVLSLVFWWNVPLTITPEGIIRKGKAHLWNEAVSISKKKCVLQAQYEMRTVMTIVYSDGQSIRFRPNRLIIKDIVEACKDERFRAMLEKAEQWP